VSVLEDEFNRAFAGDNDAFELDSDFAQHFWTNAPKRLHCHWIVQNAVVLSGINDVNVLPRRLSLLQVLQLTHGEIPIG